MPEKPATRRAERSEPGLPHSDAFVFFGATGDLAYKQIFPALQALVRARPPRDPRSSASARSGWTREQLIERRARLDQGARRRYDQAAFSEASETLDGLRRR